MPKFRKKPVVIEAIQWFKNGDGFREGIDMKLEETGEPIVKPYTDVDAPGYYICERCSEQLMAHGVVRTLESGRNGNHLVCPGDWIIKGVQGEFYACKPDIFEKTYELVEEVKKPPINNCA